MEEIVVKYRELKESNTTTKTMKVRLKKDGCPWYSFDMKILGNIKDNVLRKWKANREDQRLAEMLKHINRKFTPAKRKAKKEYYERFMNTGNQTLFWKRINELLGSKTKEEIAAINVVMISKFLIQLNYLTSSMNTSPLLATN